MRFFSTVAALFALSLLGIVATLTTTRQSDTPLFWWLLPTDDSFTELVRALPDGSLIELVVQSHNTQSMNFHAFNAETFWYSIRPDLGPGARPLVVAQRTYAGKLLHEIEIPGIETLYWLHVDGNILTYEIRQPGELVFRVMRHHVNTPPQDAATVYTSTTGTELLAGEGPRLLLADRNVQLSPPFTIGIRLFDLSTDAPPRTLLELQNSIVARVPGTLDAPDIYLEQVTVDEPIRRFFIANLYRVNLRTGEATTLHSFGPGAVLRAATTQAAVYEVDDMLFLQRYDDAEPVALGSAQGLSPNRWFVRPDGNVFYYLDSQQRIIFRLPATTTRPTALIDLSPPRAVTPGSRRPAADITEKGGTIHRLTVGEPPLVVTLQEPSTFNLLRVDDPPGIGTRPYPTTELFSIDATDMTISRAADDYAYLHYTTRRTRAGVGHIVHVPTGTVTPLAGIQSRIARRVTVQPQELNGIFLGFIGGVALALGVAVWGRPGARNVDGQAA
jgi:hypothetical protein